MRHFENQNRFTDRYLVLVQTLDAVYVLTFVTLESEYELIAPTLEQIAQTFTVVP